MKGIAAFQGYTFPIPYIYKGNGNREWHPDYVMVGLNFAVKDIEFVGELGHVRLCVPPTGFG